MITSETIYYIRQLRQKQVDTVNNFSRQLRQVSTDFHCRAIQFEAEHFIKALDEVLAVAEGEAK